MLDGLALPIICATNLCHCAQWFVHLKELLNHPLLQEDEKFLWLWLATQSANNPSCSFNYEQISHAVNKPPKVIHRILFRLRIMGFLQADIPIWYGEPTKEMVGEMRTIKIILPSKPQVDKEQLKGIVLPIRKSRRSNYINLLQGKYNPNNNHKNINWGRSKSIMFAVAVVLKKLINIIAEYPYLRAKLWKALIANVK